ncbi:MAG: hypothetical protein IT258_01235, partial [Saprospiraceae bacterium]|nr:hypothetical protein [Saprospiraceae bacterium]
MKLINFTPNVLLVFFGLNIFSVIQISAQCTASNQTELQSCMNGASFGNIQISSNFTITVPLTMTNNRSYVITTNGFNVSWNPSFDAFIGGNGSTQITINASGGSTTVYPNNNGATPNIISLNNTGGLDAALLPIELVFFEVIRKNENVDATWRTGSEINNEKFQIERSLDGRNFQV